MRNMNINYQPCNLSSDGEVFSIAKFWHPTIDSWSPVYKDILEPFNFMKYTCPRLPISLGSMDMSLFLSCPNVLRVPIKFGGSNEIRLPKELLLIKEELIRLLQYDYYITGDMWTEFFCHITIHNALVNKGDTQRFPGFHGDGLQGGKFKQKLICEHSYIATNRFPTEFAMKPFFVGHINEDRYNIFKEFDNQVDEHTPIYKARENHIYLIDPYMVHRSPNVEETCFRTFFRLTTTPAELLMPKNTVNPMFEGQEYPARIDVREFVSDPDQEIPFDFYGISI